MAMAFQPPHIVAKQEKQADFNRRLNSQDPVERWKAKEEAASKGAAAIGKAIASQAQKSAKQYQEQLREYDRIEQEYYHSRPLPAGAKIIKNH